MPPVAPLVPPAEGGVVEPPVAFSPPVPPAAPVSLAGSSVVLASGLVPPVSDDGASVDSVGVVELASLPVPAACELVLLVVVLDVDLLACRSADVSLLGLISGVLLGGESETLLPPQAATPSELAPSTRLSASAVARGERFEGRTRGVPVTSPVGPCGART